MRSAMRPTNEEVRRELRESFQHGFQLEQEKAGVLEDIAKRQRQLRKIDEQVAANEARKSVCTDIDVSVEQTLQSR